MVYVCVGADGDGAASENGADDGAECARQTEDAKPSQCQPNVAVLPAGSACTTPVAIWNAAIANMELLNKCDRKLESATDMDEDDKEAIEAKHTSATLRAVEAIEKLR